MSARFYPDHTRCMLLREWKQIEHGLVHLKPTHPAMVSRRAEWSARATVKRSGRVEGFIIPATLDWVVPCPPGEITLERVVRQIAGQANFRKSYDHITPGQGSEACGMLLGGWPVELVKAAVNVLGRWMWFRLAGLADCEPWEVTEQHWADLEQARPWREQEEKAERRRAKAEAEARRPLQGSLF